MGDLTFDQPQTKHNHPIDQESLAISIENLISDDLYMSPKCCIFKIPTILFRHNEKAYLPNAFSIGPFHHSNPQLKPTQKIKLKYLQGLILRFPSLSGESCLRHLINEITKLESQARQSYAGDIHFSQQEFITMLVLDGVFIIEVLRKDSKEIPKDEGDPIFTMSCMLQFLYHDLILLENQIPWIILDTLFKITRQSNQTSLLDLTIKFFSNIFSSNPSSISFNRDGNKHILDVLRNWLISSSAEKEKESSGWQPIPSVTELVEAGIKFKKGESNSILDIKFSHGILEIPSLLIQETTEVILRNLISFEQCYPGCSPTVTSYAKLLDNLITTTKDMNYLCKKEIFDNWLNPEDATQFFSKLYHDTYISEFQYFDLCEKVNVYSRRSWPRWRAAYMRNYFGTPWAIASQIVAVVLLVCAILQTLFTVKG